MGRRNLDLLPDLSKRAVETNYRTDVNKIYGIFQQVQ